MTILYVSWLFLVGDSRQFIDYYHKLWIDINNGLEAINKDMRVLRFSVINRKLGQPLYMLLLRRLKLCCNSRVLCVVYNSYLFRPKYLHTIVQTKISTISYSGHKCMHGELLQRQGYSSLQVVKRVGLGSIGDVGVFSCPSFLVTYKFIQKAELHISSNLGLGHLTCAIQVVSV